MWRSTFFYVRWLTSLYSQVLENDVESCESETFLLRWLLEDMHGERFLTLELITAEVLQKSLFFFNWLFFSTLAYLVSLFHKMSLVTRIWSHIKYFSLSRHAPSCRHRVHVSYSHLHSCERPGYGWRSPFSCRETCMTLLLSCLLVASHTNCFQEHSLGLELLSCSLVHISLLFPLSLLFTL